MYLSSSIFLSHGMYPLIIETEKCYNLNIILYTLLLSNPLLVIVPLIEGSQTMAVPLNLRPILCHDSFIVVAINLHCLPNVNILSNSTHIAIIPVIIETGKVLTMFS